MRIFKYAETEKGLSDDQVRAALKESLSGQTFKGSPLDASALHRVLLIPPDFTRFYSGSGLITNAYYHMFEDMGIEADVLPALGTHVKMTDDEIKTMYGDIPLDRFMVHNWRTDNVQIG
nr:nickel-dependent lactate racemase [Lachnospiraceae bacterium]